MAEPLAEDLTRQALRDFILTNFLPGEDPATLGPATPLFSSGILPSLSLLELVDFIADCFGVTLEPDDLGIERMDTIEQMAGLVAERRGTGPRAARG